MLSSSLGQIARMSQKLKNKEPTTLVWCGMCVCVCGVLFCLRQGLTMSL